MERKIGEIFEYNGEWYQCVEQPDCIGEVCKICSFSDTGNCALDICSGAYRSDNKNVIFKKLEKVGEPYMTGNKLIQRYEIYPTTYCINVYGWYYQNLDVKSWTIDIEIKQNKKDMEETTRSRIFQMATKYINGDVIFGEFEKAMRNWINGSKRESKPNLKPFDLEAAKQGKPVCTRDGRKARIICFDRDWDMHIVALIADPTGETVHYYLSNGKVDSDKQNDEDLMMLPEKKEGWANVYKKSIYKTKEDAFYRRDKENYLMTIKVEWEE